MIALSDTVVGTLYGSVMAATAFINNGGKIAILGIPSDQFAIDWKTVIFNMITIKGIYGRQMYETWYQMANLLEAGVDIKPVVTHRYSYKDFEKGFEAIREGNCGKVVLDFEDI